MPPGPHQEFSKNVFINCPFDSEYNSLLRSIPFTNMPFELAMDYACRRIASGHLRRKRFLVLGTSPHDYKQALSDLAGVDGKPHRNKPEKVVLALRNWFIDTVHLEKAESPTVIWYRFTEFTADFYEQRKNEGFTKDDLKMMPIREYINSIRAWIKQ